MSVKLVVATVHLHTSDSQNNHIGAQQGARRILGSYEVFDPGVCLWEFMFPELLGHPDGIIQSGV